MIISNLAGGEWIRYSLQLSVGVVFLAASGSKLADIGEFRSTVAGYAIIPPALVTALTVATIVVEILVGVALLGGYVVAPAVFTSLVALAAFAAGISVNLIRGRRIPCGCFGSRSDTISMRSLVRIALLAGPLLALVLFGGSRVTAETLVADGAQALPRLIETTTLAAFLLALGAWLLALPEVARSLGIERRWKRRPLEM